MKAISLVLVLMMTMGAFAGILSLPSVSAAPDTHTWDGGAWPDHLASTAANWNADTLPEAGDSIIFDATNVSSCTQDLALAFGSFSINSGYTGTVTQAASFSVTSFLIAAGTFTSDATNWITITTAWTKTAGTIDNWGCYQFAGTISLVANSVPFMGKIWVSAGTLTMMSSVYVQTSMRIDNGCTISISSGKSVGDYGAASSVFNGVVTGAGVYTFSHASIKGSYTFPNMASSTWTIANVYFRTDGAGTTKTITLSSNWVMTSNLDVASGTTATTTIDLSASNYALTTTGITLNVRVTLNARASPITDAGIWNSQNGTFTRGTSSVHLTGVAKNLWMETGGMFQNLFLDSGASYTLRTNAKTYNYWKNGTLTTGVYALTVNNNQGPVFWNTPEEIATEGSRYTYQANTTDREGNSISYDMTTDAPFLSSIDEFGYFYGAPAIGDKGVYFVRVSVTDGNDTTWQNFTLDVTGLSTMNFTPTLGIALIFSFGIMMFGFKMHELWLLAGPVWIFCGVAIFLEYHEAFMVMGVGLGIVLLMRGAYDVHK